MFKLIIMALFCLNIQCRPLSLRYYVIIIIALYLWILQSLKVIGHHAFYFNIVIRPL